MDLDVTVSKADWYGACHSYAMQEPPGNGLRADVGRTSERIVKNIEEQISLVSEHKVQLFPDMFILIHHSV